MSLHLMREIDTLKKKIFELCSIVEESIADALSAVRTKDRALAKKVILNDRKIDIMEIGVEEECLKILALHQPVATDLRFIIAALKINNELERIGDLASNIAERVDVIAHYSDETLNFDFDEMHGKAMAMLRKSLDAYAQENVTYCYAVCQSDDEVDDLNRNMYTVVNTEVQKNPQLSELILQYLSISRYLERVADHATNIAEDVIYMIEGTIVRHKKEQ